MRIRVKRWAILSAILLIINFLPGTVQDIPVMQMISSDKAYAASSAEHRYCRTMLSNKTQRYIYDKYLGAIKKGKKVCWFDDKKYKMSEDNFRVAEYAIFMDYPELLYWQNYKGIAWWRGKKTNKSIYKVDIFYNKTLKAKAKEYEARANAIVASIPKSCETDYEKALYLQDFLCDITTYINKATQENPHPDDQHTCFGPIIYGEGVCEGYARAYQDLLRRAGIKALTVYGYHVLSENDSSGQFISYMEYNGRIWAGHAWNVIWLDGKCYYADPTSADRDNGVYSYEHFCKSREEYDETYLVCESVKPNTATTKFLDRVYGTCGHESLPYIYDDANTDAKLKPGAKYYYKVEAI